MNDLRVKFQEIYERHKVDIVGFWVNAEAEEEFFYMSRYEDEADYKKKVEAASDGKGEAPKRDLKLETLAGVLDGEAFLPVRHHPVRRRRWFLRT